MKLSALLCLVASLAFGQGIPIKSGASSDQLTINTQKAALVTQGVSTRSTIAVVANALTTTAAYNLSIEAGSSLGFKLAGWCIGASSATAAAAVVVTVQRRTTASSGGTACTAEGTSSCAMSKFDPADSNFSGVARVTGTPGSAGAVLDASGIQIGEIGAGTADAPGPAPICRFYGTQGDKMPTVSAGTANGISISVGSGGSGALAMGFITAYLIEE